MGRGRLLGACAWLLGVLVLLQTLYLRVLPPPRPLLPPQNRHLPPPSPSKRGVLDASGSFRIYRDFLGVPPLPHPPLPGVPHLELVVATHGTPGRVAAALGGPLGGWEEEGPLSVAVFGVPREALRDLLALFLGGGPCRGLRRRLRLHVVVGAADPHPEPRPESHPRFEGGGGCRGALRRLAAADPPSYTLGVPYPGNLLRNLAWGGAAANWGGPSALSNPSQSQTGGVFVLLVDADVVPSRGLREGFLRLLREWGGGLGNTPGLGGGGGAWGDPKDLQVSWALRTLKNQGVLGEPKGGGGQGVLGILKALEDPKGLEDTKALKVPNTLENPRTLKDPEALENPKVLVNPNTLENPRTLKDPEALENPKVLVNPNTLENLRTLNDSKALENPEALEDTDVLEDPKTLENPKTLKDPQALENTEVLEDPKALEPRTHPPSPWWSRLVFVLPAFEIQEEAPMPGTKEELLDLWRSGAARPFYGTLCPRCQAPTDFDRWRGLPVAQGVRVAYEVPWRDPWEPFYVGPAHGVPPFDERFLQYGFNRISQACELHVAGFRFVVLDGAFVAHQGFKVATGFHASHQAELQQNRLLFRLFRSDLRRRYPQSPRHC